jgi:hypothetical protein
LKENHYGANRDWKINIPGYSSLEEKIKIQRRKRRGRFVEAFGLMRW